jgi:hypothetical protein
MNLDTTLTTEREFTAFALVAASELANRWLSALPKEAETNVRNLLANGAGLELILSLHPNPSADMQLIDVDGTRTRLAARVVNSTTIN